MTLALSRLRDAYESFWHDEVRVERLALVRIATGLALLSDQLFQYLPYLQYLFSNDGVSPVGIYDERLARQWRWAVFVFNTGEVIHLTFAFALWVLAALALTLGYKTRIAAGFTWVMTLCFLARNPAMKNGGDDILQLALFLFLWAPVGAGLALDTRAKALRDKVTTIPAWPVRLVQLQVCVMYFATGLAKFRGGWDGTWARGTSLHYVLSDITLTRWSYDQLPIPLWVSAPLTYVVLAFEVLFPFLVLVRPLRKYVLWFGIVFHVNIFLTLEVGWFSWYSLALYPAWLSDRFLTRGWRKWALLARRSLRLRGPATG